MKCKSIPKRLFENPFPELSSVRKGSARTALEIKNPFKKYYFIEKNENNANQLQQLKGKYKDLEERIDIRNGDAGEILKEICECTNWRMRRAVLFLDPFNLEVSWRTIETVAETRSIDMWFLFPISAVNRMLPKSGKIDDSWRSKLNDVFGCQSWREQFFRESGQMSLLQICDPKMRKDTDFEGIKSYTINRLKTIFPGVAQNPKVLCNSSNSPLFVLFFAVGNERGSKLALKIANHILENT